MHVASVSSPPSSPTEVPPGVNYIQTDAELRRLQRDLKGERLVALDTEAASFHRFEDKVYLIQLSSRLVTAVIDPLSVTD